MTANGINETKHIYICDTCKEFKLYARTVGDEDVPKRKRTYCYRCDRMSNFTLEKK